MEMSANRVIAWAAVAAVLALAPMPAMADNPVFGNAKHKTLTAPALKKVVGSGPTADYWGRLGRQALANSDYWAYFGVVYNSYSAENTYYWRAYQWAQIASGRLYNAWSYAGY